MKPNAHFISEETLKATTAVSDEIDSKFLNQAIWTSQVENIQPILGSTLYKRLVAGIVADDLTEKEIELLRDYITPVHCFYVMSELAMILPFKFTNKNVLKKTAEGADAISMSEIAELQSYYKNKAEFFEQRAINWIVAERVEDASVFPEYAECEDMSAKKTGYRCSIVLDDE
jgi:hypothetical protein